METGGKANRVRAEINVTPLVDIVLVLLIIFIVITPAVNNAVRLPLSKHSLKPENEPGVKHLSLMYPALRDPLTGKVTGPAKVMVDDVAARDTSEHLQSFDLSDATSRKELTAFIARAVKDLNDKRMFLKADAELPFKYVNDLFQVCREAGASEASIITSEDKRSD
jgi:biopolymer transport protein ExbD/biopolymer transport protein TolR